MTATDPRIDLATQLFLAWSSGDPDAPQPFLHPDAVLYDIVGGEHDGWPAIRAFFAKGLTMWTDLELVPQQFWTSDDGVALSWIMSATVPAAMAPKFGEDAVGRKWRSEGMTWLRVVDGRVAREVDYHNETAIARSLRT